MVATMYEDEVGECCTDVRENLVQGHEQVDGTKRSLPFWEGTANPWRNLPRSLFFSGDNE